MVLYLLLGMSNYDLLIWVHPSSDNKLDEPVFGWPFATTWAMKGLISAGIFSDHPTIKIITHHCGAMAPYFEGRIRWLYPQRFKMDEPGRTWSEHFRKFYADTALYGTVSA